jgi:hypothetical protein
LIVNSDLDVLRGHGKLTTRSTGLTATTTKKYFRTGYIKDLAPVIQLVLKLCGAKCFKNQR